MARYLEDQDREIESARRTIGERRMQDKDALDDIFDEMIAKRHQIALNAGFENFRDYQHTAMQRYDYTPDDCATNHTAIEERRGPPPSCLRRASSAAEPTP